jgi:hypothetical protein
MIDVSLKKKTVMFFRDVRENVRRRINIEINISGRDIENKTF